MVIEPNNVALQNVSEDHAGRLAFYVYVVLEDGVLTLNALWNSLHVRLMEK